MLSGHAGSKISYATVLVSVLLVLVMVKLVPAVRAETYTDPTVPPGVWIVRKILELAVTEVLATVTVPAAKTAVPCLALEPSFVLNPLPAKPVAISELVLPMTAAPCLDQLVSRLPVPGPKFIAPSQVCR